MLTTQSYSLEENSTAWVEHPLGQCSPILHEKDQEKILWEMDLIHARQGASLSGNPDQEEIVIPLQGGPGRLVIGNKIHDLKVLSPVRIAGNGSSNWVLTNTMKLFRFSFLEDRCKANAYPSFISQNEEIQLPVVGDEHGIFIVSGKLYFQERSASKEFSVESKKLLMISRPNRAQEYLNLKLIGQAATSAIIWLVIHRLPNDK